MIEKHFGKDFTSGGGALTLPQSAVVVDEGIEKGTHTLTHKSGWTITAKLQEDCYVWVNEFKAVHPTFGKVWGDFESIVYADSEDAFKHFYENHQPKAWDYGDI